MSGEQNVQKILNFLDSYERASRIVTERFHVACLELKASFPPAKDKDPAEKEFMTLGAACDRVLDKVAQQILRYKHKTNKVGLYDQFEDGMTALASLLESDGIGGKSDRRTSRGEMRSLGWDPSKKDLDSYAEYRADVVVHLQSQLRTLKPA